VALLAYLNDLNGLDGVQGKLGKVCSSNHAWLPAPLFRMTGGAVILQCDLATCAVDLSTCWFHPPLRRCSSSLVRQAVGRRPR
jgi:hypothetical protein